jgi:hypothetical protein
VREGGWKDVVRALWVGFGKVYWLNGVAVGWELVVNVDLLGGSRVGGVGS